MPPSQHRTCKWVLLSILLAVCGNANAADLVSDLGFTKVVNGQTKANVHSRLFWEPPVFQYRYEVTNIGSRMIKEFGVYGGNRAAMNTDLCVIAANALGCAPGGAYPEWISQVYRPALDPLWKITIRSDGLPVPASYGVVWEKAGGLAVGNTLGFQVDSKNAKIPGGAFLDPLAETSGFFVRSSDGTLAEATYSSVPAPSSIVLIVSVLCGWQVMRKSAKSRIEACIGAPLPEAINWFRLS